MRTRTILVCSMLLIFELLFATAFAEDKNYGHFIGDPEGRLVRESIFELTKDYEYIDPDGVKWQVSAPFETDGASIPRPFWSFIGHPLGGNYRYAAIVHDYFCKRKYPDWERVHLNFYYGMRAKGIPDDIAWIMYRAVYLFGPRWEKKSLPKKCDPNSNLFAPNECILNNSSVSGEALPPLRELNSENLAKFLLDIRDKGYGNRADELGNQPAIKDIFVKPPLIQETC